MRVVIDYYMRVNGSQHIVEHIGTHESGDYLIGQLFEASPNGYRQHPYDFNKEYVKIDKDVVDKLERQTCPSRNNNLGPQEKGEYLDHWREGDNKRTCSYCGSLHPDNVIKHITDKGFSVMEKAKNYKWYVNHQKYYLWHNTPEFVEEFNKLIKLDTNARIS